MPKFLFGLFVIVGIHGCSANHAVLASDALKLGLSDTALREAEECLRRSTRPADGCDALCFAVRGTVFSRLGYPDAVAQECAQWLALRDRPCNNFISMRRFWDLMAEYRAKGCP